MISNKSIFIFIMPNNYNNLMCYYVVIGCLVVDCFFIDLVNVMNNVLLIKLHKVLRVYYKIILTPFNQKCSFILQIFFTGKKILFKMVNIKLKSRLRIKL